MPKRMVKPYKGYPLTPHPNGYWVKVINGKQHRFGSRWCSPNEALEAFQRASSGEPIKDITIREAMIAFMVSRKKKVEAGELTQRSYDDYLRECQHIRDTLGARFPANSIGPQQFSRLRDSYSGAPTTIKNRIGRVRVLFKYLYEAGIIENPVKYGPDFVRPSAKTLRIHRANQPKKLFTPAQIYLLLDAAKPQMKAMIWLGLFAGFGNADCGTVEPKHFHGEWVEYPRPKTGISRKAWLPEAAIEAIQTVDWPLRTKYGNSWTRDKAVNPISVEFRKLAQKLGINLTFYALRHTCETVGGRCKDQVAVDYVMGHVSQSVAAAYREEVQDDRIQAVGKEIEKWLYC